MRVCREGRTISKKFRIESLAALNQRKKKERPAPTPVAGLGSPTTREASRT